MKISLPVFFVLTFSITAIAQRVSDTLPPNFSGDDPATLLQQLKRLTKSESETTAAYEARVVEEKKKPITGSRTIDDTFYLVADTVKTDYDLNTEEMSFTLPVQTNEQGVKYQVSLGGDNDPQVVFNSGVGKFTATTKLNVEAAVKALRAGIKALLFVRFEEPYIEDGQFVIRVLGLQFFAPQTGRVLGQVGATETASQIKQAAPDYSTYNKNPTFKPPRIISKPEPRYTEEARREDVKGRVVLHVMCAETGQITQIRVVEGLPRGLTERSIAAARLIKFEPAELNGKKVAYPMAVVYRFDLY